jgi:hypothetical protein
LIPHFSQLPNRSLPSLADGTPAARAFDFAVFDENGACVSDGMDSRYAIIGMIAVNLKQVLGETEAGNRKWTVVGLTMITSKRLTGERHDPDQSRHGLHPHRPLARTDKVGSSTRLSACRR